MLGASGRWWYTVTKVDKADTLAHAGEEFKIIPGQKCM